jgi:hypothetical protein
MRQRDNQVNKCVEEQFISLKKYQFEIRQKIT